MTNWARGRSQVFKRTVKVGAHSTSVHLEDAFWAALKDIAAAQATPLGQLVATIDKERRSGGHANLSSAIRLFVLEFYRSRMQPGPQEQPSMPKRVKAPCGKSLLRRRMIMLDRRESTMTLEDPFWTALTGIAAAQGTTINQLVAAIDSERRRAHHANLTSVTRLFVLDYYRSRMQP
jgi:predicted DNA-binding ribbon-helix-helix protein